MRRFIISGAPGAGKTTILAVLRERGYAVVDEAATDVIAREHARGRVEPWRHESFLDAIAALQRQRQEQASADLQVFDRSPVCTVALAHYAGLVVTPTLAREVDRVVSGRIYQPRAFLVHLLGFITPTAARRIGLADSIRFERFHRDAYRAHGFDLVEVPRGTVEERADLVERHITAR
jgi:predicted ATPase